MGRQQNTMNNNHQKHTYSQSVQYQQNMNQQNNNKQQQQQKSVKKVQNDNNMPPFESHMTLSAALNLGVHDKIDHRDQLEVMSDLQAKFDEYSTKHGRAPNATQFSRYA